MIGKVIFFSLIAAAAAAGWDYGKKGPMKWAQHNPLCAGTSQSPVNINPKTVKYSASLTSMVMESYQTNPPGAKYQLVNNGHSAQVNLIATDLDSWYIAAADLPSAYIANQFHFHWGGKNIQGSEHTVNGKAYPMEMHIVHHAWQYDTIPEAHTQPKGLAVLGFFFKLGAKNKAYDMLVAGLKQVKKSGKSIELAAFPLRTLLPPKVSDYWRYSGSLTTPTCDESVIWTVFKDPIVISQEQLNAFRGLLDPSKKPLVNNYRPTQPLTGRTVYASFNGSGKKGSKKGGKTMSKKKVLRNLKKKTIKKALKKKALKKAALKKKILKKALKKTLKKKAALKKKKNIKKALKKVAIKKAALKKKILKKALKKSLKQKAALKKKKIIKKAGKKAAVKKAALKKKILKKAVKKAAVKKKAAKKAAVKKAAAKKAVLKKMARKKVALKKVAAKKAAVKKAAAKKTAAKKAGR